MNMKKVNQHLKIWHLLLLLLPLWSCETTDEEDSEGNWVRRSYFEGSNRSDASSFVIGTRKYVVGGYTGDDYVTDLWEYDSDNDYWIKRADFPGVARSNAVAFSVGSKAYYGTGYDGRNRLQDFWEYDPATDSWTQVADFLGTARHSAIGFGLTDYGYIGTGFDGSEQKDFYQYDPSTDTWSTIVSMGGAKRSGAFVFVINDVAYIGGGLNNGSYEFDLWALDGSSLAWTQKTDLDDDDDYTLARTSTAAFTIGSYGYLATGSNGSLIGNVWEYHPSTDEWEEKTAFEGTLRSGASSFSDGERAFVLLGKSSSVRFDDIWEFYPFETYDEED